MSDTAPPSYTCPFCGMVSHHPKDIEHRFCARCDKFEDEPRPTPPPELDVAARASPAIQRIIDEVRVEQASGVPRSYNRIYSRHNRS